MRQVTAQRTHRFEREAPRDGSNKEETRFDPDSDTDPDTVLQGSCYEPNYRALKEVAPIHKELQIG